MADQTYYFQILTPQTAVYDGKHVLATSGSATDTYNGMVAKLSNGELAVCGANEAAAGVFYENFGLTYMPVAKTGKPKLNEYYSGKYCNYVWGAFEALAGPELFVSGAVPSVGTVLYAGAGGRYATSGTVKIGQVVATFSVQDPAGAYNVARIRFDFTGINAT